MGFSIRLLEERDVPALKRLFKDGMDAEDPENRFPAHRRHTESSLKWFTAEELSTFYMRFWVAVADDGDSVIGMVGVKRSKKDSVTVEVERLQVSAQHRGLGIATALMGALEEYAHNEGYRYIRLTTIMLHGKARKLYTKLGFDQIKRFDHDGLELFTYEMKVRRPEKRPATASLEAPTTTASLEPFSNASSFPSTTTTTSSTTSTTIASVPSSGATNSLPAASGAGKGSILDRLSGGASASHTHSGSAKQRERLFVNKFEFLDGDVFTRMMEAEAAAAEGGVRWTLVDPARVSGRVDLVMTDGKYMYDKGINQIACDLKCRIDAKVVTNKAELQSLISAKAPHLAAEAHVLARGDAAPAIREGEVWIWRPEGGFSGKGVVVVTSQRELEDARRSHHASREGRNRGIVSRYVQKPVLINGLKFHLRIYFLAYVSADIVRTWILREGVIATAAQPYQHGEFHNMGIHDTRQKDTPYRFPRDYPGGEEAAARVFDQLTASLKTVSELAAPRLKHYETECSAGFELFGCDYLVDTDGRLYLLEINFKPGFPVHHSELNGYAEEGTALSREDLSWISTFLYESLVDLVIRPHFRHTPAESPHGVLLHEHKRR